MAELSAQEQLMLELINRARLDPNAEAARLGITLNQGIGAGTISGSAKQPLAPNLLLVDAARAHSQWMIDHDIFSHTGAGGTSYLGRMTAAGYGPILTGAENIAQRATAGTVPFAALVSQQHKDLFLSNSGHRQNILDDDFREVGIGAQVGMFEGINSGLTTQNFGTLNKATILTGVVYTDTVIDDDFYSVGEGRSGVSVGLSWAEIAIGTHTTATGGYALPLFPTDGDGTVYISGGGLAHSVAIDIDFGEGNVKVDLIGANTIASSVTARLKTEDTNLKLLGVAAIDGIGTHGANRLEGGTGRNKLMGFGGNDVLDGDKGADILQGGAGADDFDYNALSDSGLTTATRDIIQRFERDLDDIDLRTLDARTGVAGNQAFTFIGFEGFHDQRGELHLRKAGVSLIVEGDVNGDGQADFQITVQGVATLSKADFLL